MRIAINATALGARRSGVGWFILEVLRRLPADPAADQVTAYLDPGFTERELLQRPPFRLLSSSLPTGRLYARLLWENAVLPRLLRRLRPDVFHGTAFSLPLLPVGAPCVVTVYDLVHRVLPGQQPWAFRTYLDRIVPFSCLRAARVIAISETTKRDLVQHYGVPAEKITVTYGGVDAAFSPRQDEAAWQRLRERRGLPDAFALAVGDLEPRKNLRVAIRACAVLRRRSAPLPLVLAGKTTSPEHTALLQHEVESLGLSGQVVFTGRLEAAELPVLYRAATVYLFPSLYEGFGLPAVEAMASATPVVASDRGSLPEVVGDAGLVVPADDAEQMADAVQRLATDADLRAEMVARGLERARLFTWENAARQTRAAYEQAIREAASASDTRSTDQESR